MVRICALLIVMLTATCATAAEPPALFEGQTTPNGGSTTAAERTALTLAQAIERALRQNPELTAAAQEVAALKGGVIQAGAFPNPEVSAEVEGAGESNRTTTLLINQPIELGGKRAARVAAAERAVDVASSELVAKRAEVRAATVSAFFQVLSAQERLNIAESSARLAQRSLEAASRRVAAGKISPVEETRARVAASAARAELAQAKSQWATARQQLAAILGATRPDFHELQDTPGDLASPPSLESLVVRLDDAAALQRMQLEVARRNALVDLERARRYPDITVGIGVQRQEEIERDQVVVGVSVPLPIFNTNRGNIVEALRRADKARDELTAARVQITAELSNAYTRYTALSEEVALMRGEILPGAKNALDAATRGFELGKFNFLDVLDAQRTLFQAQSQYFRALAEVHQSAADIDRVLGESVMAQP